MAELTVSVAKAIAEGQGATAWEVYQLARAFLHSHGIESPPYVEGSISSKPSAWFLSSGDAVTLTRNQFEVEAAIKSGKWSVYPLFLHEALSHAAGQEVEPEEYWVGIVRRYRSPLQRFIRMHAQFDYDSDRHKNLPRSAEDWAAVMVNGALSGHPHPAVARSEGEVEQMDRVYNFLMGISDLGGLSFGEKHPAVRGSFWWRHDLAAAYAPFRKAIASSGMGGD